MGNQFNRATASLAGNVARAGPLVCNAFGGIVGKTLKRGMICPLLARFGKRAVFREQSVRCGP